MPIGDNWGSIRGIIRDNFSFAQIKDLVGSAGLPVHTLNNLQQRFSGGASKGQLMDAIDGLVTNLDPNGRDRYVCACITEIVRRKRELIPRLEDVLLRVGWGLSSDQPHPLDLRIDLDTANLSKALATRSFMAGSEDSAKRETTSSYTLIASSFLLICPSVKPL